LRFSSGPHQRIVGFRSAGTRTRFATACAVYAILAASLYGAEGTPKRGISAADFYSLETAGDPHISADGKLVAYTVTGIDRRQNRRVTEIWVASMEEPRAARAVTDAESSTSPRWSPDGRWLAFLSARHDPRTGTLQRAQVYVLSMSGGEARRVTDLKNGASAFQWSPDGRRIVCISKIGPEDSLPRGQEPADFRVYTTPAYKFDGKGFFDDRRDHLWTVDVATGASKQITFGDRSNDSAPQWSPDGKRISYVTQPTDTPVLQGSELNVVPATGGRPVRLMAPGTALETPCWSPDGRSLAYIGSSDEAAIPKIWISPVDGGKYRLASQTVTYPHAIQWAKDGIYFTGADRGEDPLFLLDPGTGRASQLTSGIDITAMNVNDASGKLVYMGANYSHPADLYTADLQAGHAAQITNLCEKWLPDIDVQPIERLPYKGADGWDIEGFFVKPVGWRPGASYPMILMIHGGPNGMYGINWNLEAEAYAARGWAVLMTNPRGSSGYGEAFQRGVELQWGGKAYDDIMAGVDAALHKYPWIDAHRLGVTGQSFGGFMTDWIVGQTDRFRGAVTLSGISDLISVEGTRDAFYGHERDFGGDLWKNFDLYWKYSPIRNAGRVKTPTLILHGDADQRVPLSQGEEFFRALSHFGVPSELVIFPHEPHSLRTEPKHAVEVLEWQIYWFERFVAGNAEAARPGAETSIGSDR